MRTRWVWFATAAALFAVSPYVSTRPVLPEASIGKHRSVDLTVAGFDRQHGPQFDFECTAAGGGPTTILDCDDPFPNNEPDIEVDPANPLHMVASSNDYGSCCDQYYTTFDGGRTWATGNMSRNQNQKIGSDPVTVFNRRYGVTLHASLNYAALHAAGTQACDGDLVVSPSRDGGLSWDKVVTVSDGIGCDLSKIQYFNDKEWIVVDNNPASPHYGRTYMTWTRFDSSYGAYLRSPIFESHSNDGGYTWSTPKEISGANPLCTFQSTGPAGQCDENQFSVPTVGPDGTVYVAFENGQNESIWEPTDAFDSQYLVVSSSDGGQSWSNPRFVVGLEDGINDYPLSSTGRQTLTGYEARVNSAGNIVASPTNGNLYLVFSDNRNGQPDAVAPVTNVDVFIVMSTDRGQTWSAPRRVDAGAGDQWFPWVDVDPTSGRVGILYHDRGASNGPTFHTAFAEGTPTSLAKTIVSAAPSDPTNSQFFRAGADAVGCEGCATFFGDYNNVSYGSDGIANLVWTDMSTFVADIASYAQFVAFARH